MPSRSSAFSSFDVRPRSNEGINGALTPARPNRQQHQQEHQRHHRKNTNDIYTASGAAAYPNATDRPPQTPSRLRQGGRSSGMLPSGVGGEGISLQETEARIGDLERREFDLKLKLFYMEEQLEQATGGADALQLHKEVMDAKLHRAHAEEAARAATGALAGMEAKCRELEMQVRDVEAQRAKDRENWAMLEGENENRMKKHTLLLEAALRTERAENARLRLDSANRRASWASPGGVDGSGQPKAAVGPRRKSAGEDAGWKAGDVWRGSGGSGGSFGREHREQQLAARVRSQDSSLRSLRADVTTLRRQLRKQREENDAVRTAAEQVACVEAEEIARLAVDLEGAVRASNAEAEKRRQAEHRLEAAQTRLLRLETGESAAGSSPGPRSRSKTLSPRCYTGSPVRGHAHNAAGGRGVPLAEGAVRREANGGREAGSTPPTRGALGSTIASRGRCARDRDANRLNGCPEGGTGRSPGSPRRSRRDAEMTQEKKRPWGSSPPPSPRRGVHPSGGTVAGASTQTAEHKRFPPRQSDEKGIGLAAAAAGVGGTRTTVRHGAYSERGRTRRPRESSKEASTRGGRHPSACGRETRAYDADGLREYSVRERREAPSNGKGATTGTAAGAAEDDWRRSSGDGEDTPVASYLGVDLTATIARELRAAVATTPASTVSPDSANFTRGSGGGGSGLDTPTVGNGTDVSARKSEERQGKLFGSVLEGGGDLLKSIRRGGSKQAWDDVNPGVAGVSESLGEGGRGLKSKEVAELESDVQHIFQFFAAKDGRKRSELPSAAVRGESGETDVIADITKALS